MGIIKSLFQELVSITNAIDREVSKGYDLSSWGDQMKFLHALQIQAQILIDMVLRTASLLGYTPRTPLDASKHLVSVGAIDIHDQRFFRSVVGFRNIVVHEYISVDMDIVEEILRERLYRKLLVIGEKIYEYTRRNNIDP